MRWLRQHCEGGRVLVVARVTVEPSGYVVTLAESGGASAARTIASSYASREVAFAAADAIVRSRHGGHVCGPSCSGWAEDAATR